MRFNFRRFKRSPHGRVFLRVLTYLIQAVIIAVIAWQLTGIGWGNFFASLPIHPLFYLLFLFIYFLLPFSEALAYRMAWGIPFLKSLGIFIQKRVLNKDVLGYSGEVLLINWGSKQDGLETKQVVKDVRDMNILSSAASTFVAFGLLAALFLSGQIRYTEYLFSLPVFQNAGGPEVIIGLLFLGVVFAVMIRFRSYLFSMKRLLALKVFLLHSVRMTLLYCAQILQWYIVLPEIALEIWFTFLSINIIVSRIPFIPSQDLVATGTNIEIARLLQVPLAPVTGIFLVHDVLGKILNFGLYTALTARRRNG